MDRAPLRRLPSVERLTRRLEAVGGGTPRPLLVRAARRAVDEARARMQRGETPDVSLDALAQAAASLAHSALQPTLRRAVNATGVILHTNLGRAPLPASAEAAIGEVLAGYATLEIEPASGRRGSRQHHVEALLTDLTGAAAAIAVNNNAGAVLLALAALARGKQVIVSRGELVEIGGSFRLPEVMAQSGAVLVEVGTTNRTYADDYANAIGPDTALLLKVHRSNFVQQGFVHEAAPAELVALGRRRGIPVMLDLGSGCLVDLKTRGLPYEPTVQDALATGCDLVTFSGDKLLGGPQAGLIVGGAQTVRRLREHPLARALRVDKLGYAALAATLREYLDPDGVWERLPVLRMLAASPGDLEDSARRLLDRLQAAAPASWRLSVEATTAEVGGGALPGASLPSFAVAVSTQSPAAVDARLRAHVPPVFARVAEDTLLIDVRTLLPGDAELITSAVAAISSDPAAPEPAASPPRATSRRRG